MILIGMLKLFGILIKYRHFGNLYCAEHKYLIQFDEIIGLDGYIAVWKTISGLTVVENTPDRNNMPQFSPVFDVNMSLVHQICLIDDELHWREVRY